eukprot:CAMPEP_0170478222 /NCGR_PEP_ID=MMETSP0123-20130129/19307_1 /TAXON_ID=182087 /ORGANISM="Favella ehrenbergii, Strain Fehren 1" /LENGTH=82 /DNA_ID=CAMNT_0010750385 /DNA_START=1656 /DNA_END=1904 /DNA_ORIENTATION=+
MVSPKMGSPKMGSPKMGNLSELPPLEPYLRQLAALEVSACLERLKSHQFKAMLRAPRSQSDPSVQPMSTRSCSGLISAACAQ